VNLRPRLDGHAGEAAVASLVGVDESTPSDPELVASL
jgi:hypothetical protein